MRPLDTPLGRRRVRADAINIEFEERPPELRMAVATCSDALFMRKMLALSL
jgi:hypothetical protein